MTMEEEAGKPGNLGSPNNPEQENQEGQQENEDEGSLEEGLDPLDLQKIVEARLHDADASAIPVSQQQHTLDFFETEKSPHPPQKDSEAIPTSNQQHTLGFFEREKSPHPPKTGEVGGPKVDDQFQDSGLYQGENSTTPEHDDTRIELVDAPEDTVQNDDNLGIMPLPRLERTTANRRAQVQPGAFPSGGNQATEENLEPAETDIEPTTTGPPRIEPEIDNSGLAVANLVPDETTPQDLPRAQDYNLERENTNREERMKQFKTKVLLGVIVLLAIILILVAIVSPGKKQDDADLVPTPVPSEPPSSNPSQGPSTYSEYWLSLFPESTVSAIQEDPESPQSRAFEWLMEEIDILHNITEQRVVQRFVLATFYFANSKDQWFSSDNWLNHRVHECLWYSSLEDYYVLIKADILFPLDHLSPCEQDTAGYREDGVLYQGDGILKHFWLQYNGLSGSGIPPEVYLLTDLTSLAFDGLNLTSTIPEELSGLSNLDYLSMMGCGLFGTIPEAIGGWSKLGVIMFPFNSLTGTIPSSLFTLTNSMRAIVLSESQLTGPLPTELGLLTDLQAMWFDGNFFTGSIPTELAQLTLLNFLSFPFTMLSGTIPVELAVLTDMVYLQLHNSGLAGTIPRWLGNMASLEILTLLENSFTGTIPTELGLLTKLTSLWLGVNALSGTIPSEIGMDEQALVLSFERNGLTGTIPTELGLLTGLIQLWLFDNDLTGTVPLELGSASFRYFESVLLHGNNLSGIIPEMLCSTGTAINLTFDCSDLLCGCDWCNCSSTNL
ncbi:LRR receptor-like serine threonine-protein kinase [Seminavis robusta]|uniref:LRR receptor-like serine threonine-protein kinase n=1 Tax=Seminavis robusta TaxID=568900 RepID=A0A9N8EM89_9STRA|nr:LRR receptor-like serine threonine-protein kinase [Seminavis robusta]|eukprot:Sro1246_g255780.1 LRR receptor-like serine threonine-protein kinase (780) ;mRNA; f:12290-14961